MCTAIYSTRMRKRNAHTAVTYRGHTAVCVGVRWTGQREENGKINIYHKLVMVPEETDGPNFICNILGRAAFL